MIRNDFKLPHPLQRSVAVLDSGTIYLAGGLDSSASSISAVYSIDPSNGRARNVGRFAQPFHDAAAALVKGRLFVFGGGPVEGTDIVQSFDLESGASAVSGHLPVALSDLSSATIGSTVYLVGGYDGHTPRREIYATKDGAHFRVVAKLPVGLRYAGVAVAGGSLIIAGGIGPGGAVATVLSFDPAGGKISVIGRLPDPVAHAAVFELGGTVYVAGGEDAASHTIATVTSVDPRTGRTTPLAPLRKPVSDAAVVSDGNSAWLLGGLRGNPTDQVLEATLR